MEAYYPLVLTGCLHKTTFLWKGGFLSGQPDYLLFMMSLIVTLIMFWWKKSFGHLVITFWWRKSFGHLVFSSTAATGSGFQKAGCNALRCTVTAHQPSITVGLQGGGGVAVKTESGQNWSKLKVAKIEGGQNWKWSKLKVVKIESGQNWRCSKLKVVKTEGGQNWKWSKLKVIKTEIVNFNFNSLKLKLCWWPPDFGQYRPTVTNLAPCLQSAF